MLHLCYTVYSREYPYLTHPELLNFQLSTSESNLTETLRKPLPHPYLSLPMPQANPNLILMNFKLPKELKSEFQSECKARKAFMTSVLIYLMKDYLNQKSTNENQ